ncbi:hypothetical protein I551_8806 [Mycobacterium ulcerans str. Harvey]|uniref:Uncharacterized protein n=1 Tax=Mycobacterium ulcerans str. Harvey TaxID=1299332 RepID=A0ABN0RAG8_MYCUL|nr:hypothetical protein I551_8806 [Mycobacterium ulcerans str. Harvey]
MTPGARPTGIRLAADCDARNSPARWCWFRCRGDEGTYELTVLPPAVPQHRAHGTWC